MIFPRLKLEINFSLIDGSPYIRLIIGDIPRGARNDIVEAVRESHIDKVPLFIGFDGIGSSLGIDSLNCDCCTGYGLPTFVGYSTSENSGLRHNRQPKRQNEKANACKSYLPR